MKHVRSMFKSALLAAACLSPSALAFPGPDVIVGDLMDTDNYTTAGAIDGKRSYAVGTVSCNIGTAPLLWIANDNRHPVIGQTLYRLNNGRFEQIGQSWLKHGFTALQGTVCSPCTANPDGRALGVGCSDPYGAGLNGSQGGLGPKSEVNAFTGAYPYPWLNQGTGSGALFKRVQVLESDLTVAGALYFVGGMYVTADDSAAGNQMNNQSYRRVTIGAAPALALNLQGTTQRGRAAIFAWQDHGLGVNTPDPGVAITQAQAPNDGRFYAGSKVRTVGTGVWRYEYAIQNLNSHRSARSFTVPIPEGAVVTNAGFHDVPYHSGEPYNSTDWVMTVGSTSVTWSCVDPYNAANDTANAIRWDNIFNFWFDCNFPPDNGQGSLGLHRPGAAGEPNTLGVGVRIPSVNGNTRPDNDDFLFAAPISAGNSTFTNVGSTSDGQAETGSCSVGGATITGDVWFRYTSGAQAGDTTISLCGSQFDTMLYVYPGASNPTNGSATPVACNDDDPLCPTGDARQSRVTFNAPANTSYLIRVGGRNGATGSGTISIIAPTTGGGVPGNDACVNGQFVADGVTVTGSTLNATNDGTSTCGNSTTSPDVWFKYTPQTSGTVFFSACTSAFDTNLSVFSGCGGTQLACNDNAQTGPCAGTQQSYAAIIGQAGNTYLIRLAGFSGQRGNYTFTATGGGGVIPPANDDCTTRRALPLGTTAYSTVSGTPSTPDLASCFDGNGGVGRDVWYNVNVNAGGRLVVATSGTNYDARLALYTGAGCASLDTRAVTCSDNAFGSGNNARLTRIVQPQQNYTLRVGGSGTATGTGTLNYAIATCLADFDNGQSTGIPDGAVEISDLIFFLNVFESGRPEGDLTGDDAVTIEDLISMLQHFEAGC